MQKSQLQLQISFESAHKTLPRALRAARLEVEGYAPFSWEDVRDDQSGATFDFKALLEPNNGSGKASTFYGLHVELTADGENTRISCECAGPDDGEVELSAKLLDRTLTVISTAVS